MILGSGSRQVPVSSAAFCIEDWKPALQNGKSHFFVDLEPLAELDFGAANIALSGLR